MRRPTILLILATLITGCKITERPPVNHNLPAVDPITAEAESTAKQPIPQGPILLEGVITPLSTGLLKSIIESQILGGASKIEMDIDSGGGDLESAVRFGKFLDSLKITVICQVKFKAISGAAYILEHCSKRIMGDDSILGFHDPVFSFEALTLNNVSIKDTLSEINIYTESFRKGEIKKLQINYDKFSEEMVNHHGLWYLDAEQALKLGAIDQIK